MREASEIAFGNERKVAEANKNLEVQKANYAAEVNTQKAMAEQAGPKSKAIAEKDVFIAQQGAKAAEAKAAAEYEGEEASRKEKELLATVVKQAEAAKLAAIVTADGEAQATIRRAEATKRAAELEADGNAARIRQQGQATADAEKAKLVAEAEGKKAQLLAEAEGMKAKLLAEAEGKEKLAEAFKKLNEAGQILLLMEKSPEVIRSLGDAGGEVAKNIFTSLAAPLGGIDNLTVYDSGGANSATHRVASLVPAMFFDFVQQCKASGLVDPAAVLKGAYTLLVSKLADMSAQAREETPGAPAAKPEEPPKRK